jgi:hypothetical protein
MEDMRTSGPEDETSSAKVQIGAELLCKSAKVEAEFSGDGWRPQVADGGRMYH